MRPVRLRSVDVFRGLTVAGMVIVNNPGDWATVYAPLLHAEWNGWTPTDLIFPFFLFIVGVSMALGAPASWLAIRKRSATIWALGLFMAGYPFFNPLTWRIPGVLVRIAWCYFGASVIVRIAEHRGNSQRTRSVAEFAAVLLVAYWILLTWVPVPGGVAGDLSPAGNLGAWLDRALLGGHLWKPDWDPEGILSTVPAIATTLLGVIAGWCLKEADSPRRLVQQLLVWGLAGVAAGLVWSVWFPINKSLWTSSYVLFTGGLASVTLAVCYWLFDVAPSPLKQRLSEPLVALGRNAILLFVVSGLLARTLIYVKWPDPDLSLARWIYVTAFLPIASPYNASLLYALANLALLYGLLAVLHRKRIYVTV
jgi:predicted acyltransferase